MYCGAGDRFATADSFQCHGTSDGGVDSATAAGSAGRRSRIQVSASRPPHDLLSWFGRGSCALGYRSVEITRTCAHCKCFCERLIGSIRRECLDYVIPLSGSHLRRTLREWVNHYNTGRPHQSLGPGIPDQVEQKSPANGEMETISKGRLILAKSILGGLHHEYRWADAA